MSNNRTIKKIEDLIEKNKIKLTDFYINGKAYYFGYECSITGKEKLKYNNFTISSEFAYKNYIILNDVELEEWTNDHYIRGLKLTKQQFINNINKLNPEEIVCFLNMNAELTDKDLDILINTDFKSFEFFDILICGKKLPINFWEKYWNKIISGCYLLDFIKYQELSSEFITSNLKYFNKNAINQILRYQQYISKELKNELEIMLKLMN